MTPEFWNSLLTDKSWELLQELQRKYTFTLIGGWAVYVLARQQKSKDIDIVVDFTTLEALKLAGATKNDRLKKYELKQDEIDIDIYVEHYSSLGIPPEDITKYIVEQEGFNVARPEVLIILKQAAYEERKYSIKGEKDEIDILSLLLFTHINMKRYQKLIKSYECEGYANKLLALVKRFRKCEQIGLHEKEWKKRKGQLLLRMKRQIS